MRDVKTWDHNAVALLKAAYSAPFGVKRLFADPISTAASFGFDLDAAFKPEIEKLNMSHFFAVDNAHDEEVADFLHTTIVDGRFISEWLDDPSDVARKLGIAVSAPAIARVEKLGQNLQLHYAPGPGPSFVRKKLGIELCLVIRSAGAEYTVIEPYDLARF